MVLPDPKKHEWLVPFYMPHFVDILCRCNHGPTVLAMVWAKARHGFWK